MNLASPAAALALLVPTAPHATAMRVPTPLLQEAERHIVYSGDGMTVVVTAKDEATGELAGTVRVADGPEMPLTLRFQLDARGEELGVGRVQTPKGRRTIRAQDVDAETVRVTFGGERYTLRFRAQNVAQPEPASVAAAGERAKPSGSIALQLHTFADPGMGGMKSHTILLPRGWQAEGGAFWAAAQYCNVLPSQDIRVTSPQGHLVHVEPSLIARHFSPPPEYGLAPPPRGAADGGYPVIPLPADLDGWKRWLADELIPAGQKGTTNIRVENAVVIPELTWQLARLYAPIKALLEQNNAFDAGMGMHTSANCAVLGFESTYRIEGQDYEELRIIALTYVYSDSQTLGRSTFWTVERATTFRAPKGELQSSMGLMKAVADSVQMTPEWFTMRAELEANLLKIAGEIARDNLAAARKRSEIIAQSGRDLNEIITSGYREREAIRDRAHDRVIHSIRGTEEYVVPGGSTAVHLPNTYDHVFTNGNDEYLLTNDSLFEPNVDSATNGSQWTRMIVRS